MYKVNFDVQMHVRGCGSALVPGSSFQLRTSTVAQTTSRSQSTSAAAVRGACEPSHTTQSCVNAVNFTVQNTRPAQKCPARVALRHAPTPWRRMGTWGAFRFSEHSERWQTILKSRERRHVRDPKVSRDFKIVCQRSLCSLNLNAPLVWYLWAGGRYSIANSHRACPPYWSRLLIMESLWGKTLKKL